MGARGLTLMGAPVVLGKKINPADSFFATYVPLIRYKFEETSGTTIGNVGSLGVSGNGTFNGAGTLGVASGVLNGGLALDANGSTTRIDTVSNASVKGLATMTILAVLRLDSAGENNIGAIFTKISEYALRNGGTACLVFERVFGTTTAQAITQVNSFIYGNAYAFAARIDVDKVPHIFINGSEVTYGTQTTGNGTIMANDLGIVTCGASNSSDGLFIDLALVEGALADESIVAHYEAFFLS